MPDDTLPDQLRRIADEPPLNQIPGETRRVMRAAAHELEERAGRICELEAEVARGRDLAEQAWGPDLVGGVAAAEWAAHPALILGPGMRIEPRRRAVLILTASPEHLGDIGATVQCGPADAAWRLRAVDYRGMDGALPLFRVELEPVDAHAVPLDAPVRVLPFPASDLGWVPVSGSPQAADDEAMHRR